MYEAIHVECTNLRLRNTIGALLTAVALIALAGSSKKALVEALEMKRPIKPPFASEEPKTSEAMQAAALQAGAGQTVQPLAGFEFDSIYQFWPSLCIYLGGYAFMQSAFI